MHMCAYACVCVLKLKFINQNEDYQFIVRFLYAGSV